MTSRGLLPAEFVVLRHRKSGGQTIKRQIIKTNFNQKSKPALDFKEYSFRDSFLFAGKFEYRKKTRQHP
jgi:hypothetical protein